MKSPYRKSVPSRIVIVLLVILAGIIIHSCKKDRIEQKAVSDIKLSADLSSAKKWYDSVYKPSTTNSKLETQSTGKATHDLSKKFIPNWAKATTFTGNGVTYVEIIPNKIGDMAMSFTKPKDSLNYDFSKSGTFSDLILVKKQTGYSMYVMSILADSSYLKGDYSKVSQNSYQKMDANFTGAVFFKNMDGSFLNGYRYEKGQITRTLTPYAGGSGQVIQSIGDTKQHVNESAPCGAIIGVTVYEDCYTYPSGTSLCYISSVVDVTEDCGAPSGGTGGSPGGGSSSTPCTPPQGSNSVASHGLTINVTMPPPGGGSTPPPCPVTTVSAPVDPCALSVALQANTAFNSELATLKTKLNLNYETGYLMTNASTTPQTLTGPPNTLSLTVPQLSTVANNSLLFLNHTHYAATGSLSIFSDQDVDAFALYVFNGKTVNKNTFNFSVTTSQGTTYALVLSNETQFDAFYNTYVSTINGQSTFSALLNTYVKGTNSPATNEANFLIMLTQLNSGLSVLKQNTDGTWNTLGWNTTTNKEIIISCDN